MNTVAMSAVTKGTVAMFAITELSLNTVAMSGVTNGCYRIQWQRFAVRKGCH